MIPLIALGILGLTDLAILAGFYLYIKEASREREKFLNVIISKNATELRDLELTQKVEPIKAPTPSNYTPIEELSDEAFEKAVLGGEDG